jgi:hypothetical protein
VAVTLEQRDSMSLDERGRFGSIGKKKFDKVIATWRSYRQPPPDLFMPVPTLEA